MAEKSPIFIFLDGSYFCFHRYYSLLRWWKIAYPEEPIEDPYQNEMFVTKFKKTFIENLQSIPKKLNIDKNSEYTFIVGKDCKRENIWRNEIFPKYKANRTHDNFMGGPFFKMVYEENFFQQGGVNLIINHPHLEADDCIAILVKNYINKYPTCSINIITSDRDYLQLQEFNNVNICDLTYKKLRTSGSAKDDLNIKIIMGDTSDNIPSVFPKCGEKTALKCCQDNAFFLKKMNNNEEYYKQYALNKKLVDFNNIPQNLVDEFISQLEVKY